MEDTNQTWLAGKSPTNGGYTIHFQILSGVIKHGKLGNPLEMEVFISYVSRMVG